MYNVTKNFCSIEIGFERGWKRGDEETDKDGRESAVFEMNFKLIPYKCRDDFGDDDEPRGEMRKERLWSEVTR